MQKKSQTSDDSIFATVQTTVDDAHCREILLQSTGFHRLYASVNYDSTIEAGFRHQASDIAVAVSFLSYS